MSTRRPVPESLRSAVVKLKRGNLHSQTAVREANRFFERHPEPTFRTHGPSNPAVGELFDVWNVVDRGYPAPPDSFAARFGDAIHNYRCALDHVAWQLVKHGADSEPKEAHAVQFPIYDSETRFETNRDRRLPGVSDTPVEFIKSRLSVSTWDDPDNPLRILANLLNEDKHRTIKFVVAGVRRGEVFHHSEVNCEVVAGLVRQERPKLESGSPVAGFRCRCTGPNPKLRMKGTFTGVIALEDSGELLHVLGAIREEVETILTAPAIHDALR